MPSIEDNAEWVLHMYEHLLAQPVDRNDEGFKHWMHRLGNDLNRKQVEDFFRHTAFNELQTEQAKTFKFDDLLNPNDKGRVLVVMPDNEADVFLATSLLESIKRRHPDYALYVATKAAHKPIIDGNPLVDRWLEYAPVMDNSFWLEGSGANKGYFNIAYLLQLKTKVSAFTHNGEDKIDFDVMRSPIINQHLFQPSTLLTGIPPQLADAIKMDAGALGTIGGFYDGSGNFRDASEIKKFK
jgi:hypothetical protein